MTATRKQAEKKGEVEARPSGRDPIGDWLDVLESMLGVPAARRRAIRQELEDHLRSRVDDLTITGLSEPEAVRAAVGELGETADLARRFREAASVNRRRLWMHAAMFGLVGGAIAVGTVGVTGGLNTSGPAAVAGAAGGVVSAEPADEYGGMQRYSVHGLVLSDTPLESSAAGDRLVDTIVDLVQPAEWEEFGGESRIKLLGNTLFVSAPAEVREGVEWVLASLEEDAERLRAERERRAEEVVESRRAVVEGRIAELNAELERFYTEVESLHKRERQLKQRIAQQAIILDMNRGSTFTDPAEAAEKADRFNDELDTWQVELGQVSARRDEAADRIERIREVLLDLQYGVPGRPDLSGSTMAMPDAALPARQSTASASRGETDRRAALTEEKQRLEGERVAVEQRIKMLRGETSRARGNPFEELSAEERAAKSERVAALEHETATLELRLKDLDARLERVREVLLDVEYGRAREESRAADSTRSYRVIDEDGRVVQHFLTPEQARVEMRTDGDATRLADGEASEPFVYVAGAVAKRGKYPLPEGKLGLFELVSQLDIRQRGAFVQVSRPDGSPKIMQMAVAAILDGVPAKESLEQGDVVRVIVPEPTEAEPKTVRFRSLDGEERSFAIGDGGVRTVADVVREAASMMPDAPGLVSLRLISNNGMRTEPRVQTVVPLEVILDGRYTRFETYGLSDGDIVELIRSPGSSTGDPG
jgi:hypothetical protein